MTMIRVLLRPTMQHGTDGSATLNDVLLHLQLAFAQYQVYYRSNHVRLTLRKAIVLECEKIA